MSNDDPKNIFLMPCKAAKTKAHLNQTVLQPVKQATIFPTVSDKTKDDLKAIFGQNDIAVWGSMDGRGNRIFFNKMRPGDYILFSVGPQIKVVGQIALKTISPKLAKILWSDDVRRVFSLIFFLEQVIEVNTPLSKVFAAFGYKENYLMQGLTSVSGDRLKAFYENHQDILSLVTDAKG